MKSFTTKFTLLFVLLMVCSCSQEENVIESQQERENSVYSPIELTQAQTRAGEEVNEFAIKLLNEINESLIGEGTNFVISPVSLSATLGMMANGAEGETLSEILSGMGVSNLENLNSFYSKILPSLQSVDSKVKLALANSLWINSEVAVLSSFKETMKEQYSAEIFQANPNKENVLARVNSWGKEKTFGMIEKCAEGIGFTDMLIANATYFKGEWKEKFDKAKTTSGVFYDDQGNAVGNVAFMNNPLAGCISYIHSDWTGLDLSFGNGTYKMTLIVPEEGHSAKDVLANLKVNDLETGGGARCEQINLNLFLPKFMIDSRSNNMVENLKIFGIQRLFTPESELGGISESQIEFNQLMHNCIIIVDEDGAEAAATTVAGMVTAPGPGETFRINHPFIFLIRENSTNTILFGGVVNDPTK